MRISVFIGALITLALSVPVAALEKRVALVIGNSDYQHTVPLLNPTNDARAISLKLESLGFEVVEGYDLDRAGMDNAIRNFARASRTSDMNIFYYAGHGMSVGGTNYLIPIDATLEDELAIDFEAVPVDVITRQMSYADAVNVLFLDACRDNPLATALKRSVAGTTRSTEYTRGLSEMKIDNAGKGLAIAFSTSPGDVALDGEGGNSPFTTALLRHIDRPNADITEVFSRVTGDVVEATGEQQRPWLNTSLTGPVILNPQAESEEVVVASIEPQQTAPSQKTELLTEQKEMYAMARESGHIDDYQAYLDTFPNGLYAKTAQRKIKQLRETSGGEMRVARLSQPADKAPAQSRSLNEFGPLTLSVNETIRNQPANEYTEALLQLNRWKRGDIQSRLNSVGSNTGTVDGRWGPKTRRAISAWQVQNSLLSTGYLNAPQLEILTAQSEGKFQPYVVPKATVQRKPKPQDTTKTTQRSQPQARQSNDDLPDAGAVGRLIGGVLKSLTD